MADGFSVFMVLAVKDWDFGIWRNAHEGGPGLDVNADAEKCGKISRRFADGDNGGAVGDAKNAAGLAVELDKVAGAEEEGLSHKKLKAES